MSESTGVAGTIYISVLVALDRLRETADPHAILPTEAAASFMAGLARHNS